MPVQMQLRLDLALSFGVFALLSLALVMLGAVPAITIAIAPGVYALLERQLARPLQGAERLERERYRISFIRKPLTFAQFAKAVKYLDWYWLAVDDPSARYS
jgi:hypothetical protein